MNGLYRFADINIQISSLYPLVREICSSYSYNGEADFSVVSTQADIDFERSRSEFPEVSDAYLETLAVYRKIAEKIPDYNAFLFHGSAIALDGSAYIFTARSGTGKSTHARLWRELLGSRAVMVNDDKPLIRIQPDNSAVVYGTPWDGKHHLSSNIAVPVKAICILKQSSENHIRRISKVGAMPMLVQQAYRPHDQEAMSKTLALLSRLNVSLYHLDCNMEPGAAELSISTMTGAAAPATGSTC